VDTPSRWDVEDADFWEGIGKPIAYRNLWISIPNLLCGFAVWMLWSTIIVRMQSLHDADPTLFAFPGPGGQPLSGNDYRALLYLLPAVAGLAGATLRIPNSFMVAISGGRVVKTMTALLLILPALGTGIALQNPQTQFSTYLVLAALSGIGGGAFASSMSNISFFFPKRAQGLALGLNAGLGNLGVSVMQFGVPYAISFGIFGVLGGEPYRAGSGPVWIQNAGLVWVPILGTVTSLAWLLMNTLPLHQCGSTAMAAAKYLWLELLGFAGAATGIVLLLRLQLPELLKIPIVLLVAVGSTLLMMRLLTPTVIRGSLVKQFAVFRNKHNWIMTWLYTMTFGSFIGYSAAFPKLISDIFGYARVDAVGQPLTEPQALVDAPNALTYAFLGALVGSLVRPLGGWLSDRFGGARVTQWDTAVMIGAALGVAWCVMRARFSPEPASYFIPFLLLFLLLFVTTGIGNGSTFRMIPMIFPKDQAGPVLGWTSAIAAYGAFLVPTIFATQIKAGTPEYALYGFVAFYVSCLAVNWWYYARRGAEIPC
jgi:MFS transporter, NNP family, nitrate/nitrite transporter